MNEGVDGVPKDDMAKVDLSPGSAYAFTSKPDAKGVSAHKHIVFALRLDKAHNWVQLFDTGGANSPGADGPLPGSSHIFDYPLWEKAVVGPKVQDGDTTFPRGVGVLPTATNRFSQKVPVPDLAKGTDNASRALPLGFARLVLRRRAKKDVLYSTPLLYMGTAHDDPEAPNSAFSLMRYLWSLRELPGKDFIDAEWQIDIPAKELAANMLIFGRAVTISELGAIVAVDVKADASKSRAALVGERLVPHSDLQSVPNGSVQCVVHIGSSDPADQNAGKTAAARPKIKTDVQHPTSDVLSKAQIDQVQPNIPQYLRGRFELVAQVDNQLLSIRILDANDQPRAQVPYQLVANVQILQATAADGTTKTDANGLIKAVFVSPQTQATLTIDGQTIQLQIGDLPSIDTVAGVQTRLGNLGFDCGPADNTLNSRTKDALIAFQKQRQLQDQSGAITDETKKTLAAIYGH
jgi:hypothetical protein